ncbi:hypothetical protein LSH36_562g01032 [Paralvinella palmiformis]|uniref:Uncharacterized protein n=1 Tax=Paralvinella palmiformis TaxID=53620 RepID=A0AAD9MXD2_9ANNE|nr:hypothetical protein LSH36_562g01032 [Paralvinella palmiformis]
MSTSSSLDQAEARPSSRYQHRPSSGVEHRNTTMLPVIDIHGIQLGHFYRILSCLVYVYGVSSYEWGHAAIMRPDTISYSDAIVVPDPELLAPSDGVINYLDFYSVDPGTKFKVIILRFAGRTTNNGSTYSVRAITGYLSASYRGKQRIYLRLDDVYVRKNDIISFLIDDKMPIPSDRKTPCTGSQNLLVTKRRNRSLTPNEILRFTPLTRDECRVFSYTIDVLESDERVTIDTAPSDVTEQYPYNNRSLSDINNKMLPGNLCRVNCDISPVSTNQITDMYRYVIFGPLIVLWVIVSAVCSIKMKRTLPCCRKPGGTTVTPSRAGARRAPSRRGRFGRVTLSRMPPAGATLMPSQPKPMMDVVVPGIVLPPYPGFADPDPDEQPAYVIAPGYPPAYPPPAYSVRDNKTEQCQLNRPGAMPAVEEVVALRGSAPGETISGCRPDLTPVIGLAAIDRPLEATGGCHADDTVRRQSHDVAMVSPLPDEVDWTRYYDMYPGSPPSYQEATETHM